MPVMFRSGIAITGITITALLIVGAADAFIVESALWPGNTQVSTPDSNPTPNPTPNPSSTSNSNPTPNPVPVTTSVTDILTAQGFAMQATTDPTLLEQIVTADIATIEKRILMQQNDRQGQIAWVEFDQVEVYFRALKEALHATFSPQVQDIIDESQTLPTGDNRHLLTFFDPKMSSERIAFVKKDNRIYEFHIPEGKDEIMFTLIEKLTYNQ